MGYSICHQEKNYPSWVHIFNKPCQGNMTIFSLKESQSCFRVMTGYQRWQQQFPQCGQLKLICNSQHKNLQPWKNPMILLLGSGPFQHTAFPYFLVVMNIQGKNGYNNNNMSTTTRQQQHVNNTTTTTNNNNNSGDRSNSRSHNLFFVSFDTAGLGCNDRMRRKDAMMGCHTRYASGLKALLTTDAEDITCGQKRHTRKSGST